MPRERMEGLLSPGTRSLAGFLALTPGCARAGWGRASSQCLKPKKVSLGP